MMTPDPQVARHVEAVLMPSFTGTTVPDWVRRRIDAGLGGVCYFGHNIGGSLRETAALSAQLHAIRPDVLIACDEEGGDVTRLEASTGSSWPSAAALGRADDVSATREVAMGIGVQCRLAGIDIDFAPVLDVQSDPDNPVIGLRSFGPDPALVARHGVAYIEGLQSVGVAACAKHFPGHGDTNVDSHLALPVVDVSLEVLRGRDLPPFAAAVQAGVRSLMSAHIVVPAIEADVPATVSPNAMRLLREDLGFDGVVVSDALDMKAISAGMGRGPGAVAALRAGLDLLCIGNPSYPATYDPQVVLDDVRGHLLAAVADGSLPVPRLEEAARRVGELAWWVGEQRGARGGSLAALEAGHEQARRQSAIVSATALGTQGTPAEGARLDPADRLLVLDLRERPTGAVALRASGILAALAQRLAVEVEAEAGADTPIFVQSRVGSHEGPVMVVVSTPHRIKAQHRILRAALVARPDCLVVQTGLPDERDDLPTGALRTWGDSRAAGDALVRALLG